MKYDSIAELVKAAGAADKNISDIVIEDQASEMNVTREELIAQMELRFDVMSDAVRDGLQADMERRGTLCANDALIFKKAAESGRTVGDGVFDSLISKALAVAGQNACMGKIVAAPTAGSCGIIPSVLLTGMQCRHFTRQNAILSLFTAGAIGMVISERATLSGAEGGCQAECGSAAAMAAAALVELAGGCAEMAAHACAIALKSTLGLVCDPVAGLVEVPCIKRNAMGAVNAWAAADMALAGIKSVIPADEVIGAMKSVGSLMSPTLRETAEGGLAATPTGREIAKKLLS
jgi:L-serine dehydratase